MKDIFSSKLFKVSPRQEAIRAAANNPVNAELVKQLRSYLDPEYRKPEYFGEDTKEAEAEETKDTGVVFDESGSTPSAGGGGSAPSLSGGVPDSDMEALADADAEAEEITDLSDDETDESDESDEGDDVSEESVEESVNVLNNTQSIQGVAATSFTSCATCLTDLSPDVIRGTLNARDDCAGVVRVSVKNNEELWIYYNDSINLNNVMEPVISLLENAGYARLTFNRLARTDNAIVFEISVIPQQKDPLKEVNS